MRENQGKKYTLISFINLLSFFKSILWQKFNLMNNSAFQYEW